MKRIAIDLDGTICTRVSSSISEDEVKYCKLRHLAIPEYIQDLREQGNYIIIYTHRNPVLYLATKDWLRKEGIIYDELVMGKPKFDILIDNDVELQKLFPEGEKGR
jgi:uncharacterized HAD superfamily protein